MDECVCVYPAQILISLLESGKETMELLTLHQKKIEPKDSTHTKNQQHIL